MALIGIDLGTTNSLAAAFVDGESVLIPNRFGEFLTPSVVHVDSQNQVTVGKLAKERLISQPERTASLFKRLMGTDATVKLGRRKFTPAELSSLVIRQLCADAEAFLGEPVEEAVVSVPAYFDVAQRAATKQAGALAGVRVERLVNEPSAAALSVHEQGVDEAFVVFDFGGGTLDVSVVDCFDNVVGISAVSGDNRLGGSDFDRIIASLLCRENGASFDELDRCAQESVLRTAERAKRALQVSDVAEVRSPLPQLPRPATLTNALLFKLADGLFDRMKKPIKQAVYDSDIPSEDISKVVLVGGSCHMPIVRSYLAELLNVGVTDDGDCDVAVARGLGAYVGIKQRASEVRDIVLTDICPFSLSTAVSNPDPPYYELASVLIPRNTILPSSATNRYSATVPGQKGIRIAVYQGEGVYAKDNAKLTEFEVKIPVNRKECEAMELTYTYDINAILAVEAKVLSTGKVTRLVYAGDGWSADKRAVARIDSVKLAVASDSRTLDHDCLVERALRMAAESDEETRDYLVGLLAQYERVARSNSARIFSQKTREFGEILDLIDSMKESDGIFWKWEE
ncbi:Hsp70 family protein [Arabiibacter massiliensis]|uniref:Hsp70 family protein n=1 Tax=Arabiibacter massiliensis TaxID=1870985 RepID=UPI0009BBBFD1|nr:Hsp70 family protein [Arabiibacter massiliensis]